MLYNILFNRKLLRWQSETFVLRDMLWAVEEVIILTKLEMDWGKRMNDHEAIKEIIAFPVSNVPFENGSYVIGKACS